MTAKSRPLGQNRPAANGGAELVALGIAVLLVGPGLCCYLGGGIAALVVNGRFPTAPVGVVVTLAFEIAHHPSDPALSWPASARALVPGPFAVYPVTLLLLGAVGALGLWAVGRLTRSRRRAGFASGAEIRRSLSVRSVRARSAQVRPGMSTRRPDPHELGLYLGRELSSKKPLFGSLEDSFLILGPPRSGKGASLIIPGVLEAPGAAIVTSTRPDVLRHTATERRDPVEVFDPQGASAEMPQMVAGGGV